MKFVIVALTMLVAGLVIRAHAQQSKRFRQPHGANRSNVSLHTSADGWQNQPGIAQGVLNISISCNLIIRLISGTRSSSSVLSAATSRSIWADTSRR